MDEFIYTYLTPHYAYHYLDFNISINSGYVYLKASSRLTVRCYTLNSKYIFKTILLLRESVNNIQHLLETCTQQDFNCYMINHIDYEDLKQQRKVITDFHNPILKLKET